MARPRKNPVTPTTETAKTGAVMPLGEAAKKGNTEFEKKIQDAFRDTRIECLFVNYEQQDWRVKEYSAELAFGGKYEKLDNPNHKGKK